MSMRTAGNMTDGATCCIQCRYRRNLGACKRASIAALGTPSTAPKRRFWKFRGVCPSAYRGPNRSSPVSFFWLHSICFKGICWCETCRRGQAIKSHGGFTRNLKSATGLESHAKSGCTGLVFIAPLDNLWCRLLFRNPYLPTLEAQVDTMIDDGCRKRRKKCWEK